MGRFITFWPVTLSVLYLCSLMLAAALDAHTLYVDASHERLPDWLRPQPFSFQHELLFNARTRTTVARIFFVYPGHTVYTRAQLLQVLALTAAAALLSSALFHGREAENCSVAAEVIALLVAATSSIVATAGRLAFKVANLRRGAHVRPIYRANKARRTDAKMARNGMTGRVRVHVHGGGGASAAANEGERAKMVGHLPPSDGGGRRLADVSVELGGKTASEHQAARSVPPPIGSLAQPPSSNLHLGALRLGVLRRQVDRVHLEVASTALLSKGPDGVSLGVRVASPSASTDAHEGVATAARDAVAQAKAGAAAPRFLRASHVAGSFLSRRLRVDLERSAVPPGWEISAARVVPDSDPPWLPRFHAAGAAAWLATSVVLWGMLILLGLVADARSQYPRSLQASAIGQADWEASVLGACALGLVHSFLLVDLAKVLCLTFTSTPALALCGLSNGRRKRPLGKVCDVCIRKPLRRAHKFLDALL